MMIKILLSYILLMTILLFDIDGTLAPSGAMIKLEMIETIQQLAKRNGVILGLVGGGNHTKISWQMSDAIKYFKYVFAECGAVIYIDGKLVFEKNMLDYCNRQTLNLMIKCALLMISEMDILYHGTQIDFRKGLIYISPPGIQATDIERNQFMTSDKEYNHRQNLITELKRLDIKNEFEISIGGAVGIAVHPSGWNKSQVIEWFISQGINDKIYYFGDRTEPGGNDHEIANHKLVTGVSVRDYNDTITKLHILMMNNAF